MNNLTQETGPSLLLVIIYVLSSFLFILLQFIVLIVVDPERFRFARDTSFGRRHLNIWSKSSFTLWIVSFYYMF